MPLSLFTWTKDWTGNTTLMLFPRRDRANLLRQIRSFSLYSKMLCISCKCVVESAVSSAVICWENSVRATDLKKTKKLHK